MHPAESIEVVFLRDHIHRGKEYAKNAHGRFSRNDVHVLMEARAVKLVPAIEPPKEKPPELPK